MQRSRLSVNNEHIGNTFVDVCLIGYGFKNLESLGSCAVACVFLSLAVLIQCRRVTDPRTDGHTTTANSASIAPRGKNRFAQKIAQYLF